MSATNALSTPADGERDAAGRLIALVFDSARPLPAPHVNPWLVAVDGSANALRALTHAIGLAGEMSACSLHLVHVQPWLSKEAAQTELAAQALAATDQARTLLDAEGLPWRLHVVMGEPAEGILGCASRLQSRVLIVGSRGLNALESLLLGSVTRKVLQQSTVPVMVVP